MFIFDAKKHSATLKTASKPVKAPSIEVYSGGYIGGSGASASKVAKEQRAWGRDPWFLSAHMQGNVSDIVYKSLIEPLAKGLTVHRKKALDAIGSVMLKAVKANYRGSRNARGKFRRTSKGWSEHKDREGLDKRPMFATGRLYDSLRYRIK